MLKSIALLALTEDTERIFILYKCPSVYISDDKPAVKAYFNQAHLAPTQSLDVLGRTRDVAIAYSFQCSGMQMCDVVFC